jgi:hypothetical protein
MIIAKSFCGHIIEKKLSSAGLDQIESSLKLLLMLLMKVTPTKNNMFESLPSDKSESLGLIQMAFMLTFLEQMKLKLMFVPCRVDLKHADTARNLKHYNKYLYFRQSNERVFRVQKGNIRFIEMENAVDDDAAENVYSLVVTNTDMATQNMFSDLSFHSLHSTNFELI